MPITKVLVANRAEIARRVFRTCRKLGIHTVAVYSDADRDLPYVREADQAVHIGASEARLSYLDPQKILDAARKSGADAIHPGYGFLSENDEFAQAVIDAGLAWIGPPPSAMRALGNKAAARQAALANDIPTVPGYNGSNSSTEAFLAAADRIGFPVLIKASAGGGGRGMRRVERPEEMAEAIESARRESIASFNSDVLLLEKYVEQPRHIEVQVFGDHHGNVVYLFERECSIQRRHQKIVEEAPSPGVSPELRKQLGEAAVRFAKSAGYAGAGTVEFLLDKHGSFYLLEMNARLQVEHPVTELITGLDLVEWQIAVAEGQPLPLAQAEIPLRGHAIEVRLCAEDPNRDFLPATGTLVRLDVETGDPYTRVDVGYEDQSTIGVYYDSMLAKLMAWGETRSAANRRLQRLVQRAWAPGVVTNLPLLRELLAHPEWQAGHLDTSFLPRTGLPTVPPLSLEKGALAATVVAWAERNPGPVLPGWRLEGPAWNTDRWRCGTSEIETRWRTLSQSTLQVEVGGLAHNVRLLDRWRVEVDGLMETWRVGRTSTGPVADDSAIYLHFGDSEAFVQLVPRFPPPTIKVEPGSCTASTPGKVVAVNIAVGDAVTKGQVLVILEAMKMEHRVVAPNSGVVAQVRVQPGDVVSQGALLVRIDET